jgi:hypothetical protein
MSKWIAPFILVLIVALTGCGGGGEMTSGAAMTLNEDYADALSIRSQLVLGTIQLEETDLAVGTEPERRRTRHAAGREGREQLGWRERGIVGQTDRYSGYESEIGD